MPSLNPVQLAFFSYAHEDGEFAQRLAKDLRAGGAAVWMDRLDIKPGQRWDRTIEDALASCPQLLVILSPAATESTNVMDEVSLALEEGKIVLPVIHRQCKIPFRLRRLQYVDLTQNYSEGLARLLETLRSATPSSEMTEDVPQQELVDSSDHEDRAKEAKLLSQPAPREHRATLPVPKQRVFRSRKGIIGIVAAVAALASIGLIVNAFRKEKNPRGEPAAQASVSAPSPQGASLTVKDLQTQPPAATVTATPAISLSEAVAEYNLAVNYENGYRGPRDSAKAAELYEKAATSGYAPAQFRLGVLYEMGDGVSKDLDKAVTLYQKAAAASNADAIWKLGFFYEHGKGVPRDISKAVAQYQLAADLGNPYAERDLARRYERGDLVQKDINKAIELYQKASEQGNRLAKDDLARLESARQAEQKNATEAAKSPEENTNKDKVSYSIGLNIASDTARQKIGISPDDLGAGVKDALAGKPRLTSEQRKEVLGQLQKNKDEGKPLEENEKKKASYSIGLNIGFNLKRQKVEINPDVVVGAIKDAIAGKPRLTPDEVKNVMAQFEKEKQAGQKQVGEKSKTEGANFLEENRNKSGVKTTASGLQYKVIRHGTGPQPKATDMVTVNYRGTLIDGTEFDSSYKRGQPSTFPVNGVIKGWSEALQLMNVGSKYLVFIPSNLAYGERAMGPQIGPNATLIFEVELLGIKAK